MNVKPGSRERSLFADMRALWRATPAVISTCLISWITGELKYYFTWMVIG